MKATDAAPAVIDQSTAFVPHPISRASTIVAPQLVPTMDVILITTDQEGIEDAKAVEVAEVILPTREIEADEAQGTMTFTGITLEIPGTDAHTMTAAGQEAIAGAATATGGNGKETVNLETGREIDPGIGTDPANDPGIGPEKGPLVKDRGIGLGNLGNDLGTGREIGLVGTGLVTEGIVTLAERVGSIDRGALDTAVVAVRATVARSEVLPTVMGQ